MLLKTKGKWMMLLVVVEEEVVGRKKGGFEYFRCEQERKAPRCMCLGQGSCRGSEQGSERLKPTEGKMGVRE